MYSHLYFGDGRDYFRIGGMKVGTGCGNLCFRCFCFCYLEFAPGFWRKEGAFWGLGF